MGNVKSYSSVKGFCFILHPDITGDIWFARDSLAPELRTSDIAGNKIVFDLARAPDGKPQARNLMTPKQAGIPTPGAPAAATGGKGGAWGDSPGVMAWTGFMNAMGGMMRPPGMANGPSGERKRALSPHAGSRAIALERAKKGKGRGKEGDDRSRSRGRSTSSRSRSPSLSKS